MGNWEVCTCNHFQISHFPKSCWPIWAGAFLEIGKWEVCTCNHFPISHFPKSCWPIWAGVFWEIGKYVPQAISQFPNFSQSCWPIWAGVSWEIGKLGNMYLKPFPNFPIFQIVLAHLGWCLLRNWEIGKYVPQAISQFPNFPNRAGPSGLGSFGKLGNRTSSHFPISQFFSIMLAHLGWGLLGNWEFGKLPGRDLFLNRGCVYKHGLGAPINIPILSPCVFINARCVHKHGFGTRTVTQNVHYC